MSGDVGVGLIAAGSVVVGSGLTFLTERWKGRSQRLEEREAGYREHLRAACATHASNLTHYVWLARSAGADTSQRAEVARMQHESRVSIEMIRLLSKSVTLQEAGRMALRHAYAISETSMGRPDPRPDGQTPSKRFDEEFKKFLVAAREELGIPNAPDVFAAP